MPVSIRGRQRGWLEAGRYGKSTKAGFVITFCVLAYYSVYMALSIAGFCEFTSV